MSSGEAEYYAVVRAVAEGLGAQALLQDLGVEVKLRTWIDSSAAKSVASRTGIGRIRHLEVRFLWLQEVVKQRKVEIKKIKGLDNPADVLTKPLPGAKVEEVLKNFGMKTVKRKNLKQE